jgi:hypothetical protein
MEQKIRLNYINIQLNIGMVDIRHFYQLAPDVKHLNPEVYRGKLVYRAKGSSKRISYDQIKKGLLKQTYWITEQVPNWLVIK